MHRRYLQLWLLTLLALCPALAGAEPARQQVSLYLGNVTDSRIEHETQVVKLALEKSRQRYGDYALQVHKSVYSRSRALRSLRDGELINVVASPQLTYQMDSDPPPLITVDIPLLKGLLGARRAIVRRERQAEFEAIESIEQLRKQTAGLGFDWVDRLFFEHNQLPFTTGNDIAQLYNMLAHKRFDYLPLSLIEATPSLQSTEFANQLVIIDNLVIHYPLPVYLQVSVSKPRLAERIEYGLSVAQEDGSLEALFERYYGSLADSLDNNTRIELAPPG